MRAALDASRAVADHPVEPLAQFIDDALHAFFGQRVLVARLRGGEQVERVDALVANQRLAEVRVALRDVDEVEHHAAFGAHDEIEVAQADVEVDDRDLLPGLRESGADGRC